MKAILKKGWHNIEKFSGIISVIVSLLAIVFSIKSCNDSNKALKLAQEEFEAKRNLVLTNGNNYSLPNFPFEPMDKEMRLQRIILHSPKKLESDIIIINPPSFDFDFDNLQEVLKKILNDSIKIYVNKDSELEIPSILVPLIIRTNYIAQGENLWNISLYNMEFYFYKFSGSTRGKLSFRNLMYEGKFSDNEKSLHSLDEIWRKHLHTLIENVKRL